MTNPKPNFLTKKYSVSDIASSAWQGVKLLSKFINSETHVIQVQLDYGQSTAAVVTHLSPISQGDFNAQRTGHQILVRGIELRSQLRMSSSATSSIYRMILFYDTWQVADSAPTASQVLANSTDPLSAYNFNNSGRFRIIFDDMYNMDIISNPAKLIEKHIDLSGRNIHVGYNGTAVSDVNKNGFYLLTLSSETTNTVATKGLICLYFHDN
jgi:hypothetical protein